MADARVAGVWINFSPGPITLWPFSQRSSSWSRTGACLCRARV